MSKPVTPRAYDAGSITVQSDIEGIRSNPGMYFGDVGRIGSLQAFIEIVQNATDETRECGGGIVRVHITGTEQDGYEVTVADRGRGIPTERHPTTGVSTLETVLTRLHAGGKSHAKSAYGSRTIGVHGVGAAATNACSTTLDAWSFRSNAWYHAAFRRGVRVTTDEEPPPFAWPRGTVVRYRLDRAVLPEEMRLADAQRFCALARYWDPITIQYHDPTRAATLRPLSSEQLLTTTVQRRSATILAGPVIINGNGVRAVVAWTDLPRSEVVASVAGTPVPNGTHVQGLEDAVRAALQRAHHAPRGLDGTIGLLAVLDVSVDRPSFAGQNKTALKTGETRRRVREVAATVLERYVRSNRTVAERAVEHAVRIGSIDRQAAERREMARGAAQSKATRHALPLKFKSATEYPPAQRELFLLEGDSAAGCAIEAKMPWQEILPLSGKLPNLIKRSALLANETINDIINVIGYDHLRPERPLRVGKIVILCDADDDGSHIEVLLLAALHRVMPEVLQRGVVYTVDAPLYEAMDRHDAQVTGNDLQVMTKHHGALKNVNRMKGWGGCEAPLLREVAFAPATRRWIAISAPSTRESAKFLRLMGSDVSARRELAGGRVDS